MGLVSDDALDSVSRVSMFSSLAVKIVMPSFFNSSDRFPIHVSLSDGLCWVWVMGTKLFVLMRPSVAKSNGLAITDVVEQDIPNLF